MSSEGPAPLHVGSVSVGVASVRVRGFYGSREKEAPPAPCMVGGPSLSALAVIGTACFFAGQLSSSDSGQGRALEVRCACSETAEVSAQFTLEQDESRVWWYAALWTLFALAGGLLCGGFAAGAISVAWWQRFTSRPEHPFVR